MSIPDGVCWSCRKPISARQKTITFPGENLFVPAGPPVIYHAGITECRRAALDYQDRWVEAEPGRKPLLGVHDPYPGRPNQTQRRLLALAAAGKLGCHLTEVRVAKQGDDVLDMIENPRRYDPGDYRWYPDRMPRAAEQHIPPLLEAGLLAEPFPDALRPGSRGSYELTDAGRETLRRYPAR